MVQQKGLINGHHVPDTCREYVTLIHVPQEERSDLTKLAIHLASEPFYAISPGDFPRVKTMIRKLTSTVH